MIKEIISGSGCTKCGNATVFVKSMSNGFVRQNCVECKESYKVTFKQLPQLACPTCSGPMRPHVSDRQNYSYKCFACNIDREFHELLPSYRDLGFPEFHSPRTE